MEPMAQPPATLVDLLDRVLERGLFLQADIIISLAGVPLIGINLRAAVAGMDTMLRYGLLQEWGRNVVVGREEAKEALPVSETYLHALTFTGAGS